MHALTKQLTEYMLEKYQLTDYVLYESSYARHKLNDQTVYSFETFWIPRGASVIEEEDGTMLPEGTVQITIDPVTKRTTTLSLHGPNSIHSVPDDFRDPTTRMAWIESETDMIYGTHFMLEEENDTFFSYVSCHEGIRLSPGCFIHLTLTENGQLDELFLYGPHPSDHHVKQEPFALTLEDIDSLAKQQIKRFSYTKPGHQYAHTVVETFMTQEGSILVPSKLDFTSSIEVNDVLSWTGLPSKMHERYPYQSGETVTANDVITQTEHPDFRPISQETVNACHTVIKDIIQNEYPADSGQWMIRYIYRQHPYLAVKLSRAHPTSYVDQQRRVTILLDEKTLDWISLTDDQELHTVFASVTAPELEDDQQDVIFNALRPYLLLTPRYVFDVSKGHYVLCGLLDSNHAYLSATNEVVLLRDL
ncbi:hypothetical protein RSA42_09950 [Exiguobacterium indicum]|uniref:hypothetical protein n=1 Tax=Exiguobacterium indicum TaxID=296995 RepID=UPI00073634C7|nr:hypothetical protein [Exiguobacterium indicum]KTR59926.1 hypothetical protein RSA42_09950 [Exiguobacterium indicum]